MNYLCYVILSIGIVVMPGCVGTFAQAPVNASFNWRGSEDMRIATTDGRADGSNNATIQADKTNETQAAVSTSTGNAKTGSQSQENGKN